VRNYDAAAVARLDRRYSIPQMDDQRRRFRAIVGAQPGEMGLDIGCGAGHLVCELAPEVAPGGRVLAIDRSPDSVDATKARVAQKGLAGIVETRIGDAASLEFPDQTFDFVVSTQVYCYVPDVASAIREAARVLRKGGRLVILDSDWDLCTWESGDPSLTRRMLAARENQFAHAHLPRQLHSMIHGAGLKLVDAQVFSIIETQFDSDSFGVEAMQSTCEAALKYGVPAPDVAAWERDMRSRSSDGEWFFCLNRFIFAAKKDKQ
jgi:ubiquinone/menaquinone biosynthesis C-methylase UbiE